MAYNTDLESRIEKAVARWKGMSRKNMFGGVCYLLNGNMCFGIWKDFLIVRAGEEEAAVQLKQKNVKPFDITGKPMKGWFMVDQTAWRKDTAAWLKLGKAFAGAMKAK